MGLDLWFREDVARILASTQEAMRAVTGATAPLDPEHANAYRQGFADALQAIGVAFGVAAPAAPGRPERAQGAPTIEGQSWRQVPHGRPGQERSTGWPE